MRIAADNDPNHIIIAACDHNMMDSAITPETCVTLYGRACGLYTVADDSGTSLSLPFILADRVVRQNRP